MNKPSRKTPNNRIIGGGEEGAASTDTLNLPGIEKNPAFPPRPRHRRPICGQRSPSPPPPSTRCRSHLASRRPTSRKVQKHPGQIETLDLANSPMYRSRPNKKSENPLIRSDTTGPIFICGPTASGKSAFALEMARQLGGEIVNADAFQLYRGLDVLTAAPSAGGRAIVPHHLYGVLDPAEKTDAGSYMRMAKPVIAEIQSRGRTPIITGGSGLYLKFLTHGPAPLPTGDAKLRAELDARPLEDLVAELRSLDPVEASRTALQNRRFVSRALEICLLTGTKASGLRDQWESQTREISAGLRGIVIRRTRPDLHARIGARTRGMLDGGAIAEVAALRNVSTNCEKAIGFREIRSLIAGETDRATCEDLINAATRQYAKRQETWFRREKWLEIVNR
jgi:tRNA dimethylallyltransferase